MKIMKTLSLLAAVGTMSVAASAQAATFNWSGGAGTGVWSTKGNWSQNNVPGAGDDVIFNTSATITSGIPSVALNSITVSGSGVVVSLTTASATPTVTGTTSVASGDTLEIASGLNLGCAVINNAGTFQIDFGGTVSNSGVFTHSGTLNIYGLLTNNGRVDASGPINIGDSMHSTQAAIMDNFADLRNTSNNSTYTILANSFMKFEGNVGLTRTGGTPTVSNSGEVQAIAGTMDIDSNYTLADVTGAVWRIDGTAAACQMNFNKSYTLSGDFHLVSTSPTSVIDVVNTSTTVSTAGNYFGSYGSQCSGKIGNGAFHWGGSAGYPTNTCP